jgi:hypothetical protein
MNSAFDENCLGGDGMARAGAWPLSYGNGHGARTIADMATDHVIVNSTADYTEAARSPEAARKRWIDE